MKIYLAGKVGKNDWRHGIVSGLRNISIADFQCGVTNWPIMSNAIFDSHDYTGPYFVSDDHGSFHGKNNHGNGIFSVDWDTDNDSVVTSKHQIQQHIVLNCRYAIERSDMIFVWMDNITAYGTLAEVGYASALRKTVVWAQPSDNYDLGDIWFARTISDYVMPYSRSAKEALQIWLQKYAQQKSPPNLNGSGVYLLQCGNEHYKIGMAGNIAKRVKQIQTNTPFEVKHIHTINTNKPADLEIQLHQRFASKRVRGEWFALTPDDVMYICGL